MSHGMEGRLLEVNEPCKFSGPFFFYDDTMELPPELVLTGAVSDDKSTAVFFEIF